MSAAAEEMVTQVTFDVTDATVVDGHAVVEEFRRRGYELTRAGELERTVAEVRELREALRTVATAIRDVRGGRPSRPT